MALWDELQNPTAGAANDDTVTVSFSSTPSAGNLLVAVCHANTQHDGPPSGGWQVAQASADPGSTGVWGAIYWKIAAGNEGSVTVEATGATRSRLHLFEFDAAGQTVVLNNAATPNGNSTNVTAWQVPSLAVDGLAIAAVLLGNNAGTWGTFDSSYATTSTHTGGGANPASAVGTRVVSGTVAPTITWTTGRMPTGMHVSFKVDAPADPVPEVEGAGLTLTLAFGPGQVEIPVEQVPQVAGAGFSATLALGPAEVDSFLIEVDRTASDEATVAYSQHDADRHVVEHYRGEALVADYDPAANPQTVVNVEDGDQVRVGAVTDPPALASLDDPTFEEAAHRPVTGRRQIVRTSDGTLWLVNQVNESAGNDAIAVWRWSGTDWVVQDYSGGPRGNTIVDPQFNDIGLVVDSNDVLHIVAPSGGANVVYVRFDTDTGQFEGQEQIEFPVPVGQEVAQVDLAIDSGDDLHLIGLHNDDGFTSHDVYYARRSSGSWSEPELVDTQTSNYWQKGAVQVDSLGQVVIVASFGTTLMAYRSGFGWDSHAVTTVASRGGINAPGQLLSAVIDANDDVWVAYLRSDLTVGLVRHDSAEDWDTWDTPVTNGEDATSVAVGLLDGAVQVLWIDGASVAVNVGHVWHDAYDGAWAGATEVITDDAGFPGVAVHWQQHNFTPQGVEFIWWDGTKPVHASLSEPTDTVLWSKLVPIPDFGDVPTVSGAGIDFSLSFGPGVSDAPTATVPQVAGAGVMFTLAFGPGSVDSPTATIPEVSGAGLDLTLTLGPGVTDAPTATVPEVSGAGSAFTLTFGPGATEDPGAQVPEVAGAGLAFTLGLGPGQVQAVTPILHEVEGAGLHLTVTFGPGDTRHPATGPLVDLVARPLDAYIRPSAVTAAFIAPTAVGAAHIADSAALEAHSRDKAAADAHINRPGGTAHIPDKPHTEPHINRPQSDTLVNA